MRRTRVHLAILVAAGTFIAGCGGGGGSSHSHDDGGSDGGAVVNIVGSVVSSFGEISVFNATLELDMLELYVVPSASPDWGDDILVGIPLAPGEIIEVALLDPGDYDCLALFEDGSWIEAWSMVVEGGDTTDWDAALGLLVISNITSDWYIDELYVVESSSPDWGWDLLGGDWIGPGEEYVLWDVPPGSYDIMAVVDDGWSVVDDYGIDVDAGVDTVWELIDY